MDNNQQLINTAIKSKPDIIINDRNDILDELLVMRMDGYCGCPQTVWNIIFALMVIIGQVSQNVALPIWFSSVPDTIDPLWIVMLSAIIFQIFFGICVIIFDVCINKTISNIQQLTHVFSWKYTKRYIILGTTNAIAGLLITFAARKCAPYLQTILGTVSIFWVIFFRYLLLKKKPTSLQFIYAIFVFGGLFLTSVPSIFGLNEENAFKTDGNSTWKVLWPFIFAMGFAPNAILCVMTEDVLKQTYSETPKHDNNIMDNKYQINSLSTSNNPHKNVEFSMLSIWWVNFMETSFQWIIWIGFFWVDALPTFGTVDSIDQIFHNLNKNWRYMFGLENECSSRCVYLPILYNVLFLIQAIGYSMMVRYSEGSAWVAIVNCLVSPLGAMFWFLFELDQDGWFGWKPNWKSYDLYAFAGMALMTPFIYLYNIEASQKKTKEVQQPQTPW